MQCGIHTPLEDFGVGATHTERLGMQLSFGLGVSSLHTCQLASIDH